MAPYEHGVGKFEACMARKVPRNSMINTSYPNIEILFTGNQLISLECAHTMARFTCMPETCASNLLQLKRFRVENHKSF